MTIRIHRIAYSDALFEPMLEEAGDGGGPFLFRLRDEWKSGVLRFEGRGELLLGALREGQLVGVGGISVDPYHPRPGLARVRHLYVLKEWRGRGIGRAIMERLLEHARGHFQRLRLTTLDAGPFYERLGFVRADGPKQTHLIEL